MFHRPPNMPGLHTAPWRVVAAILAGAISGGALVSAASFAAIKLGLGDAPYYTTLGGVISTAILGTIIYCFGLLLISPIWFGLDRLGCRRAWVAATFGAALSVIAPI